MDRQIAFLAHNVRQQLLLELTYSVNKLHEFIRLLISHFKRKILPENEYCHDKMDCRISIQLKS